MNDRLELEHTKLESIYHFKNKEKYDTIKLIKFIYSIQMEWLDWI